MDKQLNDHEQEKLLKALELAKKARRAMEAKEEEKRWAPIEVPLTLDEALARLTKNELSDIRLNWNVRGASALKKQDLIAALRQLLPEALPDLLIKLDDTRCKIMRHIADHGGHAFVPLEECHLDYFKSRGLIFTGTYNGQRTLAMPQEVLQCFADFQAAPAYRETIRRNTEWVKLTHGLLFYYGTLSLDELERQINSHTGVNPPIENYLPVLEEAESYYRNIYLDSKGFSNARVFSADRVLQEHAMRTGVPFYPFTKTQLLLAGEPDFVERNASYRAFVDFIVKNYTMPREEADSLVEECVYAIRIGEQPGDLLRFLQMQLEMEDLETLDAFMEHIEAIHNNTRQWFIKGYTPNELSASRNKSAVARLPVKAPVINMATRKAVGRNDPCPCGSGKKFKKCCGQ